LLSEENFPRRRKKKKSEEIRVEKEEVGEERCSLMISVLVS